MVVVTCMYLPSEPIVTRLKQKNECYTDFTEFLRQNVGGLVFA